jgi:hypothetical protein
MRVSRSAARNSTLLAAEFIREMRAHTTNPDQDLLG